MPPRNRRSGTAVRQAWPRQGGEFIARAGQGLATLARCRKRWQRTVYWVKNIQMILFTAINIFKSCVSFPARRPGWNSFKLSMIYGGMPNWLWSGHGFPRAVEEEDIAASPGDQ